jgi:putative flippase GtrA
VLKLLRIRALRSQRGLVVWGIPRGKDVSECSDVVLVDLNEADWLKIYSKRIPKLIALPLSEPLRVLVFIAVGVSGILVNLACAHIVHGLLSGYGLISYPVASTSGFESSVLWNFTLHEKVTFRGTGLDRRVRSVFVRLVKYHIASIGSWITQVSMATTLPLLLRTPFLLAQFVGIVLGFAVNFILGYIYTWSMHRVK